MVCNQRITFVHLLFEVNLSRGNQCIKINSNGGQLDRCRTVATDKLVKIRSQPHYLSQADGLTVEEFEMSEYGSEYSLDISNIMWGSTSNDSHVFDTFSEFTAHRDSTKTRLDMLRYVAENNERYKWDCHVLLSMLNTQLDTWLQRMAYWVQKRTY